MSMSGYSKLFLGIVFKIKVEHLERTFKRFDVKTGLPISHTGDVCDVYVSLDDKVIKLPNAEETFQEATAGHTYSHQVDYNRKYVQSRLYSFFTENGCEEGLEIGKLGYRCNYYNEEETNCLVGVAVASGSSYSNRLTKVDMDIEGLKTRFALLSEPLQNKFGVIMTPSLYLHTTTA